MADQIHVIVDQFDRPVMGELEALKSSIVDGMNAVVGEVKKYVADAKQNTEVADALQQLNKSHVEEITALKNLMSEIKTSMSAGTGGGSGGSFSDMASSLNLIQKHTTGLHDFFINKFEKQFKEQTTVLTGIAETLKACCSAGGVAPIVGGASKSPTETASASSSVSGMGDPKETDALIKGLEKLQVARDNLTGSTDRGKKSWDKDRANFARIDWLDKLSNDIGKAQNQLMAFTKDFDILKSTFKGMAEDENKFIRDTRAATYEIEGITGATHGLQDAMTNIGKTVAATGFNRTDFQAEYLKALKSGIKDQKTALAVTTAQLNTEKQLGLEAGAMSDTFIKMKNEYNMSNMQIAEMGRGMRDVARFTGLTGKNLEEAVKSSQSLITVLRNAATLTAATAKNVMEITTNAKKLGVEEQVSALTKAMASSTHLFTEASNQTKAFLFQSAAQVGRTGDLMNGTILKTKAGIKDMAKGMEMMLKKFGVESLEAIDTLSDSAKMKLNIQLKASYGLELGELQNSLKALKESSKTLANRLDDIKKKQQGNLTLEEKIATQEEARRLKTSKSFEMLTALDEAAKGAKDMNGALAQFGKRQKDFEGDLKAMGKSWGSSGQAARAAIDEALKGVNESLKGSGKSELKIDSSEIEKALKDPVAFRELSAKLSKAEQEAATAQKAALDPMSKIEQGVHELNDTMRNFSSKFLSSYMNLTGVLGILAPALTMIAAQKSIDVAKFQMRASKHMGAGKDEDAGPLGWMEKITGKMMSVFGKGKNGATNTGEAAEKVQGGSAEGVSLFHDDVVAGLLRQLIDCLCNDTKANKIEKAEALGLARSKEADLSQIEQGKLAENQDKAQAAAQAGGAAAQVEHGKAEGPKPKEGESGLLNKVEGLKKEGPKMAMAAGVIIAVGMAVVLLGIVLMKLASLILGKLNLNIDTMLKTTAMIAIVVAAAAAIALAVYESKDPLEKMGKMLDDKESIADMKKGAKAIMILGPALILLSVGLLSIIRGIAWVAKIDWKVALKLAADIAAIIGATAAIAKAVQESEAPLEALGKIKCKKILDDIWASAKVLLTVAPAILLLAVVLLKICQLIAKFSGFNAETAFKTASTVAALIAGAGLIAIAVVAGSFGLTLLGGAAEGIFESIEFMAIGAMALMLLTPVLLLLGVALMSICSAILKELNISTSDIKKTTEAVAALTFGVGIISIGIIAMAVGLAILGILSPIAVMIAGLAVLGAAAFIIMSAPILLLAEAIVEFGTTFDELKLTPGRMYDIAATMIVLTIAISVLAMTMISANFMLAVLATLSPIAFLLAGFAVLGSIAFIVMSEPIMMLAEAIAGFGDVFDDLKLTPDRMFDIASTMIILTLAIAALSVTFIVANSMLAILGTFGFVAVMLAAFAMIGAGAFLILAAPIMYLAGAIAGFGEMLIDDLGLTPQRMSDISSTMLILTWTIAKLAAVLIVANTMLAILGVFYIWAAFGAAFAWIGVLAFNILARPIMMLASTIATFGGMLIDDMELTPQRMSDIRDTFVTLTETIAKLSMTMIAANAGLAILGLLYAFSWWAQSLVWMGVAAFYVLAKPLIALAKVMAWFGSQVDIDEITIAAKAIDQISATLGKLPPVYDALINNLIPLTQGGWFWGKSPIEKIDALIPVFKTSFEKIASFVNDGIVMPILDHFGSPDSLETAAKICEAMATVIGSLPPVITGIVENLLPLMRGNLWGMRPSKMEKALKAATGDFSKNFRAILEFISTGIIDPIFGVGGGNINLNPKDIETAAKIMTGIADLLPAIPVVIEALNGPIARLNRSSWSGKSKMKKTLDRLGEDFRENFSAILHFVSDSIIDPIFGINTPQPVQLNPKDIEVAAKIMTGIAEMLPAIPAVVEALNGPIARLNRSSWSGKSKLKSTLEKMGADFRDNFTAILFFISDSIVDPIFGIGTGDKKVNLNPQDIAIAAKIMTGVAEMLPAIPTVIETLNGPIARLNNPSIWDFGGGRSRLSKTLEKLGGDFKANLIGIFDFIGTGILDPVFNSGLNPRDIAFAAKAMKNCGELLPAVAVFLNKLGWQVQMILSSKDMKMKMEDIGAFAQWFANVSKLLTEGMIIPIKTVFPAPEEVEDMSKRLQGMSDVVAKLPEFMKDLYENAQKCLNLPDIKGDEITQLSSWFRNVASLLGTGIVWPIMVYFPEPKQMESAIDKLDSMSKLMDKMPGLVSNIADMVVGITGISKGPSLSFTDMVSFMTILGLFAKAGIVDPIKNWPADAEIQGAIDRITKIDQMFKSMIQAMESLAATGVKLSGLDIGKAFDLDSLKNNLGVGENGGLTQAISTFVNSNEQQLGMGDTNMLSDELGKQSPAITSMQSVLRDVEGYTGNIKDLFERSSSVIDDIRKTTEYMSMFGDLDIYEKQIAEKIAGSKQFVPTVQRIAEKIGKGFDFSGGKQMLETIKAQDTKIGEMKEGLKATETYTKNLADIFTMASNTVTSIKTTTGKLDQLKAIGEVEKGLEAKISSGNSFMVSVLGTIEKVAKSFGTSEDMNKALASVQEKIKQAGVTSEALTESMNFIETIKKMKESVLQVGQAASQVTTLGGGVPGAGMPPSIPTARVNLTGPEPTQVAAHTVATDSTVKSQIEQERATSTPASGSGSVQDNTELQSLVKEGNTTHEEILEALQTLVAIFTRASGGGGVSGNTRTQMKQDKPASYGKSPLGGVNTSSGKGGTNVLRSGG